MGERGPEKGQAFGAAALTQALHDIDFPKSKDELISEVGDTTIQVQKGHDVMVRDIMKDCTHDTFNNMADVVACDEIKQNLRAA